MPEWLRQSLGSQVAYLGKEMCSPIINPPTPTSHITYNMVSQEDCPLQSVWVKENKGKFYDESGSVW